MEIITKIFEDNHIKEMVTEVLNFLKENRVKKTIIMYGWECKTDNQYADIEILFDDLEKTISRSQKDGVFKLGVADLYISDIEKTFEFLLCHESDIHFKSDNEELVEKVRQKWSDKGYVPYNANVPS